MFLSVLKRKRTNTDINPFNYKELNNISFGKQQGEQDEIIKNNFIITDRINQFLKGNFNYVLSPKGFGKSALFKALENKYLSDKKVEYNKMSMIFINQAFGFDDDYLNPKKFKLITNNKDYIFAWAIFLVNKLLIDVNTKYKGYIGYDELINNISKYKELKEEHELYSLFDKIEQWNISLAFEINGQHIKITPKIGSKNNQRRLNLNKILNEINEFYKINNLKAKIYIDRIDRFVANTEYNLQKKYIQGLFDTIEEISQLSNINATLFLRTDLFYSMDIEYEHDKVRDRIIELEWTHSEILEFILYRLLSNEYIYKNYMKNIQNIVQNEVDTKNNKTKWWYLKKKKYDLRKNLNFRFSQKCLNIFFPHTINHKNSNFKYEEIEFTEWIFSHFSSINQNINPRCLIWFFNNLFKKQYKVYQRDPKLIHYMDNINPIQNNDCLHLPLFLNEVIEETYSEIQNDELKTITGLLKTKEEKEIFKKINSILYEKNKFNLGDINLKNYNVNKEEYSSLIKYLTIIGFIVFEPKNRSYKTPIIYRKSIEL